MSDAHKNAFKFIVHINSDEFEDWYTGPEQKAVEDLTKRLKTQWEEGTVVLPSWVVRMVVLDTNGKMVYDWTRPSVIVHNYPPQKKSGWFEQW